MYNLHRELNGLNSDLCYAEAIGDTELVKEIKRRMAEIERFLDNFYADPITQSISL